MAPSNVLQDQIREYVEMSLAIEAAAIDALSEGAAHYRRMGREVDARVLEERIRAHRVGMMKHRAMIEVVLA